MSQEEIKRYEDKRNWVEYNEKLVRRGEMYLSLEFVENWHIELAHLNNDKRGRPFEYPEQFCSFVVFVHIIYSMLYRQMEGFLRQLSKLIQPLNAADYTTLFKRIAKLEITLKDTIRDNTEDDDIIIAVDSTGIKVTNRGEWMREKWRCIAVGLKYISLWA